MRIEIMMVEKLTDIDLAAFNPIFSPDGSRIAFSAGGRGESHVYTINVDASGLKRLTDEPGPNFVSCFSPDGMKIAYISDPTGDDDNYFDIYTMWTDGSNKRRLTRSGGVDPTFSPDGRFIVFLSDSSGIHEVFRITSEGNELMQLTRTNRQDNSRLQIPSNWHPVWSPDGEWIYFSSSMHCLGENQVEIYRMRPDGTEVHRLSHCTGDASHPTVSPDGLIIAFTVWEEDREAGIKRSNIYTIRADGTDQKRIEDSSNINWIRSFSPDGNWIAFDSPRDHKSADIERNWDIYLIRTDGSELIRLTDNDALDREPIFSPDGSKIAFTSDRNDSAEIYLMHI